MTKGLFELKGKGGRVERSRVKLIKNRIILDQFYFTLFSLYTLNLDRPKEWYNIGPQYNKSYRGPFSIQQRL